MQQCITVEEITFVFPSTVHLLQRQQNAMLSQEGLAAVTLQEESGLCIACKNCSVCISVQFYCRILQYLRLKDCLALLLLRLFY